ncbi:MAG: DUF488 domain-containing protein [Candidatus Moranbacteria bacterium]|nr:DUF488 domain-containing protein [Candidatus Moranbacteria bacterium]
MPLKSKVIYTIGHSTRPANEFIDVLNAYNIEKVLDVRTVPKSRHNPQFNKEQLGKTLEEVNIGYQHLKLLGGLRHTTKNSVNLGWKNASFRGYADYMQTADFSKGLDELINLAEKQTVAVMCAEAVPWRCHRSMIADALTKKNFKVIHILNDESSYPHRLTAFLKIKSGKIFYPKDNPKKFTSK